MSRLRALAANCLRLAIEAKNKAHSLDAGLAELIAELARHAEDAVTLEEEQLHKNDSSRGVGA